MKATEAFVPASQRLFDDKIVIDFLRGRFGSCFAEQRFARLLSRFSIEMRREYSAQCFAGRDESTTRYGTPLTMACEGW